MKLNLNKIEKYLILSDLVFYSGWGLISPIFAIFLLNQIQGGNVLVVGLAAGINLIVRSLFRVPFGIYADKNQRRAYHLMLFGLLFSALIPIGYIFARTPVHIYVLQALLGTFLAMSTAGWVCIFSRHLDKRKESTEWGIDAVAVGIGPGIAGILGGIAVTFFSFNLVFIAVAIIGLIGVMILLFIRKKILRRKHVPAPSSAFRHYTNHTKKNI